MSLFPSGPELKKYYCEIHFSIIFSFFVFFSKTL